MTEFRSLPGFRDFYPEAMAVRLHIMGVWREVARRYGFEEYDGPPLESLDLYREKSGEEIVRQLYNFVDKGGREVALRPEMTPTLARMVGPRARSAPKPIRWFSIPQLFRYERTQRGRLREHFQWNVDVIGESDITADAEVLAVALDALRALGLTADDVVARVSDRRLLERLLLHAGVPRDQLAATYAVIDKLGREEEGRIRERLSTEAGLGAATVDEVFGIFEHRDFDSLARAYAGVDGLAEDLDRLGHYFSILNDMGLGDFVSFDPSIVRGLAYYTGTVFEVFDRKGEFRAVCGGGRYDNLLRVVSGIDLPALGFGMGDVVLTELLADRGLLPGYRPRVDVYLIAVTEEDRPTVLRLAHQLRDAGYSTLYALRPMSVGKQFKDADTRGAARVLVVGPEEREQGVVMVRVMETGEEKRVPMDEVLR
ncbi:MAG TPA: histidine--tRNA ligase [Longimicrobiales bacterium]|nr:histidine--tRNA ligase [Longimicrobiales bacterium]